MPNLTRAQVRNSMIILMLLVFSKNFYTAAINNYFQFYTIQKFGFSNEQAQLYLFYFLGAVAAGTLIGGFFGDKVGRKFIIWFSILGTAPFALWLHYRFSFCLYISVFAGVITPQNRNDFGLFLRFCLWYGRFSIGTSGQTDRFN